MKEVTALEELKNNDNSFNNEKQLKKNKYYSNNPIILLCVRLVY